MASPALVGTRPQRTRDPTYTRDSNALRASVLDAAFELGVGTSRAVENLIFDSILEDDEVSIVLRAPFPCFLHPSFPRTIALYHLARRLELVTYDTHLPIGHSWPFFPLRSTGHHSKCPCPRGAFYSPRTTAAPLGVAKPALSIAPVQSRAVSGACQSASPRHCLSTVLIVMSHMVVCWKSAVILCLLGYRLACISIHFHSEY